ncbi:peptidase M61 [soil metagenome]
MKKLLFLAIFLSFFSSIYSQTNYTYYVDLNNTSDHQTTITLNTPKINSEEVMFRFPKLIPGTYVIYDYGRFISELKAFDKSGNELSVEKSDVNSFKITNASKLAKITYRIHDTFTSKDGGIPIFEPAGTNITSDVVVINSSGFYGYFDDMKNVQIDLHIKKPAGFYGSTALIPVKNTSEQDDYNVENYYTLIDSPMLYCVPDTTIIKVGDSDILISVYSPDKKMGALDVKPTINEILLAAKDYLGELPVKKYAFLYYMTKSPGRSMGTGALEHSYSSMYFLFQPSNETGYKYIGATSAHEFFHIITPLSIHSTQIGSFDYNTPQMSKHLWMYEGATEYTSMLIRERYKLITPDQFLKEVENKLRVSDGFKLDIPFSEFSERIVEDKYNKLFTDVYFKGAMISMALDLKLRKLSGGTYGLVDLLKDLSKTYGKDRSFNDDELFDEIALLTYPEIKDFFKEAVETKDGVDFIDYLKLAGIENKGELKKQVSTGGADFGFDTDTKKLVVTGLSNIDAVGKELKYKVGDQVLMINGTELTMGNIQKFFTDFQKTAKEGDALEVVVARKGDDGKVNNVSLKAVLKYTGSLKRVYSLSFIDDPTESQLKVRRSWLKLD